MCDSRILIPSTSHWGRIIIANIVRKVLFFGRALVV
jgi:hypothetical protein